jgi:hypothetical protein
MNAFANALVAFVVVAALACVGGGTFLIVQRETGTRARATVADCVQSGGSRNARTDCTGSWVIGGSLVGGGGHVVVGNIDGAETSDVGKTIDVTVSGGTAYTRSLALPIVLIGLGLVMAVGAGALIRGVRRGTRRASAPAA